MPSDILITEIYMNSLLARLTRFTLLLTPLLCFGVSPKIARDLVGVPTQSTVTVIIRFSSPLDDAEKQKLEEQGGTLAADPSVGPMLDHVRSLKTFEKGGHA